MKDYKLFIISFLLLIFLISAVNAVDEENGLQDNLNGSNQQDNVKEIYVNDTGDDFNTGSNSNPYASIEKALSNVSSSDDTTIYLSKGTFSTDNNTDFNIDLNHKQDGGNLKFIGAGADKTMIDGQSLVRFASIGINTNVTFKGISFINFKNTNGSVFLNNGILNIENCVFKDNYGIGDAKSIIYSQNIDSSLIIINSIFDSESTGNRAIYAMDIANLYLENNTFKNIHRISEMGIAIYIPRLNNGSIVYINKNKFFNLKGTTYDGSFFIRTPYNLINPTIIMNNVFINCSTESDDYSIVCLGYGTHTFSNNTFINSSNSLGNIYTEGQFTNLVFNMDFITMNITDNELNNGLLIKINNITDDMGNIVSTTGSYKFNFIGQTVNYTFIPDLDNKILFNEIINNGLYNFTISYCGGKISTNVLSRVNVSLSSPSIELWVSPKGSDSNNGSKTNPLATIQQALDMGFEKSFNVIIHLMEGIYFGENNVALDISNKGNLQIIGEKYNETIIDGENCNWFFRITTNTTIKNVKFIRGYGNSLLEGENLFLDNCIIDSNNAMVSILDKVSFNNLVYSNNNGHIYYSGITEYTIVNSYFYNNVNLGNGGVIYTNSKLNIVNCSFINNTAINGGVLYASNGVNSVNNYYQNNSASYGGVFYVGEGTFSFTNDTYANNEASNNGGVVYIINDYYPLFNFNSCIFINNSAIRAGSIGIKQGNIINSEFINNSAEYGGAIEVIAVYGDKEMFNDFELLDNMVIENVTFENNIAQINGNDMYICSMPSKYDSYYSLYTPITNLNIVFNRMDVNSLVDVLSANVTIPCGAIIGGPSVEFILKGNNIGRAEIINGVVSLKYYGFENGYYIVTGKSALASSITSAIVKVKLDDPNPICEGWVSNLGSDEYGNGSKNNPFASISKALDELTNNSLEVIIHICEGVYSGNLNTNLKLSSALNIVLVGEGSNKTIIDGGNINYFASVSKGSKMVTVSNLTVKNMLNNNSINDMSNLESPISIETGANLFLDGVNIINSYGSSIIENNGTLLVINSLFYKNGCSKNIIYNGEVVISNSSLIDNFAKSGMINAKNILINNSIVEDHFNSVNYYYLIYASNNAIIENTNILNTGKSSIEVIGRETIGEDNLIPVLSIVGMNNTNMNNVTMVNRFVYSDDEGVYIAVGTRQYPNSVAWLSPDNAHVTNSSFFNMECLWITNSASSSIRIFDGCLFDNLTSIARIFTEGEGSKYIINNSIILSTNLVINQKHYDDRPIPQNILFDGNYWGNNQNPIIRFEGVSGFKTKSYSPNNWAILSFDGDDLKFISNDENISDCRYLPVNIYYVDYNNDIVPILVINGEGYLFTLNNDEISLDNSISLENVTFKVPVNQTVFANDISIIHGSDVRFSATFTNKWGDALNDCNVSFVIKDNVIKATTDENGTAYFNIDLALGSYIVEVINPVTSQSIFRTVNVTTDKSIAAGDVSAVYGDKSVFSAVFTDEFGYPLINAAVSFNIGDDIVNVTTDEKGSAMFTINFNAGSYNITSVNPVTGQTISNSIVVSKVTTEITAPKVSMVYNDGKYLTVTLKDANDNYLVKSDVTIKVGSNVYNRVTDSKGQVKLLINLAPNTYSTTVSYSGGNNYISSSLKTSVIVKKATPKIAAAKKTFKKSDKTKKFTITLKNNKNKVMKNTKVYIKVNGKTYAAKTNGKGKATFKITKLTKKGTFKATITYKGSKYFNKVTKKVNIKIK